MRALPATGKRRGLSLVETIVSAFIIVLIIGVIAAFSQFSARLFAFGQSDASTQGKVEWALQVIARDVRPARRLGAPQPNQNEMTLQLPKYDQNGDLVLPIQDGDRVRYFFSGTSLARSINGDPAQALIKDLGPGGTFTMTPYYVDDDKDGVNEPAELRAVTISIRAVERVYGFPTSDRAFPGTVTVYLHNRDANDELKGVL